MHNIYHSTKLSKAKYLHIYRICLKQSKPWEIYFILEIAMNSSIFYIILYFSFEFIRADEYFKIKLQKGGKWSDDEMAEYLGHIPAFSEFTACHWEKLKYFATRSNTVWSYCKVHSVKDETLRCLQLYSYGLKSKAYRSLSYNIWITGMQNNETIVVEIELPSYRHRT